MLYRAGLSTSRRRHGGRVHSSSALDPCSPSNSADHRLQPTPTDWRPGQVRNPPGSLDGYFSEGAAWDFIATMLEQGHEVEDVELRKPPGKTGYVMKIELEVSTPGPGRGRARNTTVGDGLVPSRGRRDADLDAGDHKGRPYGFFTDIQRVADLFHGRGFAAAIRQAGTWLREDHRPELPLLGAMVDAKERDRDGEKQRR